MANLRFVPDFEVTINDRPIPSTLRASISSLNYQTGLEGSDRVELTLVNESLRWLDRKLFGLDNSFTLSIGYAPDPLKQVFVGEIVGHSATFGANPTFTVVAQDRLQRLQQGKKVRWFAIPTPVVNVPIPDPLVTSIVALERRLLPILEPVAAAVGALLGGIEAAEAAGDPDATQRFVRKQAAESDFDFLARLAKENGWEMSIDHSGSLGGTKLRFFSPADHLTPDVHLKFGHSLIDFNARITNVGQILAVTVFIWIAAIKMVFVVTLGWDWDRMSLILEISPSPILSGDTPADFMIEEPATPSSAARKLVSELIPKLNSRLTATGSTVGDPRILANTVLQLEGLGEEFGGLYRVTSATHTIDGSGYRTSFEVRKEIWFGSIPKMDQGASPVQFSAGFEVVS